MLKCKKLLNSIFIQYSLEIPTDLNSLYSRLWTKHFLHQSSRIKKPEIKTKYANIFVSIYQRWARATFFWVRNRNSATLKEALLQVQFRNFLRNVAPQPQLRNCNFFKVHNFKSATWELHFRNFWHFFGHGIRFIHEQKNRR